MKIRVKTFTVAEIFQRLKRNAQTLAADNLSVDLRACNAKEWPQGKRAATQTDAGGSAKIQVSPQK